MTRPAESPDEGEQSESTPETPAGDHVNDIRLDVRVLVNILMNILKSDLGIEEEMPEKSEFDTDIWKDLRKKHGDFTIIMNAERHGLDEHTIRRFLGFIVADHIHNERFSTAFRILKNTKKASDKFLHLLAELMIMSLFADGKRPTPAEIAGAFGEQKEPFSTFHREALERLKSLPPLPPEPEVEEADMDDEEGEFIMPVEISADVSVQEMWKAIWEALTPDQSDYLVDDLYDEVPWCSEFLLVDSQYDPQYADTSVRVFCSIAHEYRGELLEFSLEDLEEWLPVRFTNK